MRVTGVIQAGGRSVRMGGDPKALLDLGGRSIIERVVRVIREVVDDVVVVTNTPDRYAFLGLRMIPDVFPDGGSLGGIYSGLAAASGDAAFTVACDMPFLRPEVARLVVGRAGEADVIVPRAAGQLQALHALYAKACLPIIEERVRGRRLKIADFFDAVRTLEIPETEIARHADPAVVFMNVNTLEELAVARTLAAREDARGR